MEKKAAHDLIPLELAVQAVYARLYEAEQREADLEQLNEIAHAISARVPLFTYDKDPTSVRRLSEQDLQNGRFRDGGRIMLLPDGRAPIRALAVSAEALNTVVRALSEGR